MEAIYQIKNTVNNKIYIGSTTNIKSRWGKHKSELNLQRHPNAKLQNAWNKYGEDCFEFSVLEEVDKDVLLEKEQYYLDHYSCEYNLLKTAYSTKGYKWDKQKVKNVSGNKNHQSKIHLGYVNPEGQAVVIDSLNQFCKENNLNSSAMRALASGKNGTHKGWTHKNSKILKDRTYRGLITPEGVVLEDVSNLSEFCKERGLDVSSMVKLFNNKLCSYKGYSVENGKIPKKPHVAEYVFISPEGVSVQVKNVSKFCRENNLDTPTIYKVINSVQTHHHGWRIEK